MSSPATTQSKADAPGKHLRILYADDMGELRSLVENLLQRDGHTVEGVADGVQALQRIAADLTAFDVVFTDHHMPNMDGLELVKQLRLLGFPGKIFVFSSELSPVITLAYEGLKVNRVIPKPIHPRLLREILAGL
jgi:CheY-like chemotaxis protein